MITDSNAAIEQVAREKATGDPGSVGSPMVGSFCPETRAYPSQSGVVVEVRIKEGQDVKAGDPLCVLSAMKVCCLIRSKLHAKSRFRWSLSCLHLYLARSSECLCVRVTRLHKETW